MEENGGKYRVWVRTRDWVKQWDQTASPGRFELLLNGKALEVTFGTERAEWHWQDGGTICLKTGENRVELRDLTGFDGRCDAIFFTSALEMLPPDGKEEFTVFRRNMLGLPEM